MTRRRKPSSTALVRSAVVTLAVVFLIAGALSGPAAAAPGDPRQLAADPELARSIRAAVEPYVLAGDFMGVVAVGRRGEAPLLLPFGRASVELDIPHAKDGIFMIGSVSKQFTAAAILLLEEDGRLSTDDPLSRHLPGFPNGEAITIEQLLTHTSGVTDVYSLSSFGTTGGRAGRFDGVVAELAETAPTHPPGSAFLYSNGGYALLAAIVERASGVGFGEFLERRIFEPLGLESTAHDAPGPAVARRVPGYDPWGAVGLTPAPPVVAAYTAGSGSIWSSGADLVAWAEALHGGRLLAEASYAKLTDDHGRGYGYGVSVFERFGRRTFGHDGRVAGYSSDLAHYPEEGATVAVVGNVQSVARDEIRRLVAAALFGEEVAQPERPELAAGVAVDLADLEGVYAFGPSFEVSITTADGRLLARANQGGFSELVPTDGGEWFSRMLYATVRFGRNEEGAVDRLIWGSGEGAPEGSRVD